MITAKLYTHMKAGMRMATSTDILTLTQWLSPSYPVGAFSYSHGLEWAIQAGQVTDAASFQDWLGQILNYGSGRNDAILLTCAYHAQPDDVATIDEEARAFAPSRERLLETTAQGAAFCRTTQAIWGDSLPALTYPVALGHAARVHGFDPTLTCALYLHAFASNLVSAAIRLVPLGQTEGQAILTALAAQCQDIAVQSQDLSLDDLGGSTLLADIASMKHETQYTRLFRS